jgi:predicted DNA-binding protein (MmcQ/YjbR family)
VAATSRSRKSRIKALESALRKYALSRPQATEDFPWGERAIKVRGKAFLFMRATASELSFSVKLPTSSFQALVLPFVKPTEYGLGRHGWVTVTVVTNTAALREQFTVWIDESYRAVAPKSLVKERSPSAAQSSRSKARGPGSK